MSRGIKFAFGPVTGPAQEPVTIDEIKGQARVTHSREDASLAAYIGTAREIGESYTGRGFFTQTWRLDLSEFVDVLPLPMAAPLQSVTSVQYYATDGTLTTLASSVYIADTLSTPGRIVRAPSQSWPATQADRVFPIRVTYVVGWSDVALIPEAFKQGIRFYAAYLHLDREGMLADGVAARSAAEASWRSGGQVALIEPGCEA